MKPIACRGMSRREFVRRGAAAAVCAGLAPSALAVLETTKKLPVGVQLYSVRALAKKDFPAALKAVSDIGFKGVEFAGYFGRTAPELKKMLDDNGLTAIGTHTQYPTVKGDQLARTVEYNHILGNTRLIVPMLTDDTAEKWKARGEEFAGIAQSLKSEGMQLGYHSHQHDFNDYGGQNSWDIFGKASGPDVIMQLDTGNCYLGGGNPLAELKKFPGRTKTTHIKPGGGGPDAVIGEDRLPWADIFAWCDTQGGTEWYIVEHETSSDPVDALKRTYAALKTMGRL